MKLHHDSGYSPISAACGSRVHRRAIVLEVQRVTCERCIRIISRKNAQALATRIHKVHDAAQICALYGRQDTARVLVDFVEATLAPRQKAAARRAMGESS